MLTTEEVQGARGGAAWFGNTETATDGDHVLVDFGSKHAQHYLSGLDARDGKRFQAVVRQIVQVELDRRTMDDLRANGQRRATFKVPLASPRPEATYQSVTTDGKGRVEVKIEVPVFWVTVVLRMSVRWDVGWVLLRVEPLHAS